MENEITNTDKSSLEPRKPLLHKTDVISRFGECKYSCQLTYEPSWFHTIIIKDFTIYIEEWFDYEPGEQEEFICVIYHNDNRITGRSSTNLANLIDEIEKIIKNEH